jgi:hypothetical protein
MEGINKIFCGSDVKNTGVCECFFNPDLLEGAIAVPRSLVLTEEQLSDANIAATMQSLIQAASKNQRIYPWAQFVTFTDSTEDDTVQTFGYGGTRRVREGNYNWFFQFTDGGVNLSNALRSFNGLTGKYRFLFLDFGQNTIIGTSRRDADGNWGLGGIPMQDFKTRSWRPADGTNTTVYGTDFSFKPSYINENIAFKKVSTDSLLLSELVGLEDIKLIIAEVDGDTLTVTAESDCGSTDMYDDYADEFNTATAWVAKDADGELLTFTVAKNDAAKGWDLVLDAGVWEDGDTVESAAPAVLAAPPINVSGYEGLPVTVVLGSS